MVISQALVSEFGKKAKVFDGELAACRSVDPELFFPESFMTPYVEETLRNLCMNCAIWRDCYDYALTHKVDGYWAGTSSAERKRIRQREGIKALPMYESYKEMFQATTPGAILKRNQRMEGN